MSGEARPFVSADMRAESRTRPGWLVNFTRAADGAPALCAVPGDSEAEAIARAVQLAIVGGFVPGAGEVGNVEAEPAGLELRIVVLMLIGQLETIGVSPAEVRMMELPGREAEAAPARPSGFVVPRSQWSKLAHGVAFVLAAPALAWAHHEVAIAELVSGLWITVPAAVLAALHAIDSIRFWWRDGARLSYQGRRLRLEASRGLTWDGWHVHACRRHVLVTCGRVWRFESWIL